MGLKNALRRLFGKTPEQEREEQEERERLERQKKLAEALLPHYLALKRQQEERLCYIAQLREEIAKEDADGRSAADPRL